MSTLKRKLEEMAAEAPIGKKGKISAETDFWAVDNEDDVSLDTQNAIDESMNLLSQMDARVGDLECARRPASMDKMAGRSSSARTLRYSSGRLPRS